ncbi:MAG: alpha-L-fucosidase [Planctomycetaceae bacterium]
MPDRTGASQFLRATPDQMQWWREARFGMFIHWGPAAIGGSDISWSRQGGHRIGDWQAWAKNPIPAEVYDKFYTQFNPTLYDARQWVATARAAGMKYMVLTTKHHDGFCLFDTRYTTHRVTAPDCPCQRDLVRELADACHEAGMKLGLYYSARDWFHEDYLTENHHRYLAFYHAQLLELLCNYGRVDVLWFDHIGGPHHLWDPDLVLRMARRLHPGIIINDRLHASVLHGRVSEYTGDFETPEGHLGAYRTDRAWESCLCLCDGGWSFTPGTKMMTFHECISALAHCAGGDGNLLLNTGPMPDGRIEPRQGDLLKEIGQWLALHGETIYATRGGPLRPGEWGACTHRGNKIFLHILQRSQGTLELPPIEARVLSSNVRTGGQVQIAQTPETLSITLNAPAAPDTIVEMTLDRDIAVV